LKNKMINLLPPENKIAIKKEYLRRLVVVFGIFLLSIILVIAVLLITLFFIVNNQKKAQDEAVFLVKEHLSLQNEAEISSLVSEINSKISLLSNNKKNAKRVSEIIEKIIGIKTKEIKITSLSFDSSKISIYGTSETRTDLINFIEDFKKEPVFSRVNFPLSNFLKEGNVEFNIVIELSGYEK